MKRKLVVLILALSLMVSLTLTGCRENIVTGNYAEDVIKIGWIGDLSGPQSEWGLSDRDSLKTLESITNISGGMRGKTIQIVFEDMQGDINQVEPAVRRLINDEKVVAILGLYRSDVARVAAPLLAKASVPGISSSATDPNLMMIGEKPKPYLYRICFDDIYATRALVDFASKNTRAASPYEGLRVGMVTLADDEYSKTLGRNIIPQCDFFGMNVVADLVIGKTQTEFESEVDRIVSDDRCDALFINMEAAYAVNFINYVRQAGVTIPFYASDAMYSDQITNACGVNANKLYIATHVDLNIPFVRDFTMSVETENKGKRLHFSAVLVHDAYKALEVAIDNAEVEADGTISSIAIAKALDTVSFEGLTGRIRLWPDTHSPLGKDCFIVSPLDGKFSSVKKVVAILR